jgi:eukaryotic-like serine/threonine-protein kinase
MIGQMLSHYRVVEQIGSGGMGVVYRAHDEQLDRDVALKVITPGTIANDAARSRFRKEALALAKLDHPNIATVFEFGTEDGTDFLVTAFIPGLNLDAKLAARALPEKEVVGLGLQMAKGLSAAHERGVIHCDLKPGNLRLTPDGLLKILDFGLARFVDTSSDAETLTLTHSQEISGTLPYMAPEQLRAEPTDPRTDIWSAGVVLYEMATGVRPFREKQPAALIHAILNATPKSPREVNSQVSAGLENIILKAIDKNAAYRYQSARELAVDLERLQAGSAPLAKPRKTIKGMVWGAIAALLLVSLVGYSVLRRSGISAKTRRSVAVLGFKNLGKPDQAWVSTALSEMLTTELATGGQLRTIPGETVSRMKADLSLPDSDGLAQDSLAKVYKVLGSDVVVVGSYLNLGDQIRINFRVQDSSGETIATASEQGTQSQFFDLIKRVGSTLREKCGAGELTQQELEATRATQPTNTEAARYYAEGLDNLRQFDALAARDSLQLAVKADPANALAHSALAAAWSQLGYDQNALDESAKAFQLSDKLPRGEKLSIEARYRETNHEWAKAVDIYHSLWTFFPDDLDYGLRLAAAQVSAGQGQQSLQTVQALRQLPPPSRDDPRIDLAEAAASESLSDFKREVAATKQAREKAQRQGSRFTVAQSLLGQCWAQRNLGELESARSAGEQAQSILSNAKDRHGEAGSLTCVANVLADQGKLDDAKAMHQRALDLARQVGAQKDIAGALINLGNVSAQRNVEESTANYEAALTVATAVADKSDMLSAQNNIAANLMTQADFSQATKMLLSALKTAEDLDDPSSQVAARINLGTAYFYLGNLPDSKSNLGNALAMAKKLGLKSSIASAFASMGSVALVEDDLSTAEGDFQQSLAIRTEIGEQSGLADSWNSVAGLNLERKDLKAAAEAAQKSIAQPHSDDQEAMARNYLLRSKLAQKDVAGAKSEYGKIRNLKLQDKAVQLSLGITEAQLLTDSGNSDVAIRQLNAIVETAKRMELPGYELEARLALGSKLKLVEEEALAKGFKLIARKARERAK